MATHDLQSHPVTPLIGAEQAERWPKAEHETNGGQAQKPQTVEAGTAVAEQRPHRSEASRQNGRKSRGPKTEEGKNRSRCNALKHGLRAALLLEAGNQEENTALGALRATLEQQFSPRTVEEQLLLESLVHALWQKQRGLQFEARELRHDLVFHGPVMDRILRYATAADKRLFRSLAELKRLHEGNNNGDSAK
jgi:hypothetical protein